MDELNIDHVYVAHVKKGYDDRKVFIDNQFSKFDIYSSKLFVSYEDSTLRFVNRKELKHNQLLYEQPNGRCAGAYLISLEMANSVVNYVRRNKCDVVIDWFHNYLAEINLLQFYWCEPVIADQGSHSGMFEAGLSHKKQSFLRRLKWKINSTWKGITK